MFSQRPFPAFHGGPRQASTEAMEEDAPSSFTPSKRHMPLSGQAGFDLDAALSAPSGPQHKKQHTRFGQQQQQQQRPFHQQQQGRPPQQKQQQQQQQAWGGSPFNAAGAGSSPFASIQNNSPSSSGFRPPRPRPPRNTPRSHQQQGQNHASHGNTPNHANQAMSAFDAAIAEAAGGAHTPHHHQQRPPRPWQATTQANTRGHANVQAGTSPFGAPDAFSGSTAFRPPRPQRQQRQRPPRPAHAQEQSAFALPGAPRKGNVHNASGFAANASSTDTSAFAFHASNTQQSSPFASSAFAFPSTPASQQKQPNSPSASANTFGRPALPAPAPSSAPVPAAAAPATALSPARPPTQAPNAFNARPKPLKASPAPFSPAITTNNNSNTMLGAFKSTSRPAASSPLRGSPAAASPGPAAQDTSSPGAQQRQPRRPMTNADRAARFGATNHTNLYEQMKQQRVEERRLAIEQKLMPDPDAPTSLAEAIDFRGTCTSMCPEFEMVERELQNGLDVLETNDEGQVDPNKAVKRYRRSAAGIEQPLPSDVRPPDVLLMTLDYLMNEILPNHALERCHAFIRDRTRSIRQDFTLQNIRDVSAVEIHERVARFHILSLHELSGLDEERFSIQQEMEQLRKVLLSLTEFYDDLRQEEKVEMPNEPEFRAYYLLCHPRDPDVARQMQSLPPHVFRHPMLERARKFRGMMQRNNEIKETPSRRNKPANVQGSQNMYAPFFKLVAAQDTPFLMACLLETHFPDIRKGALKAMNVAYHSPNDVTVADVAALLQYDSQDDLITEARLYGLQVTFNGQSPVIQFHKKHPRTKQVFFVEPLSNPKPRRSNLVESKKGGLSLQAIVDEPPPDMAPMVSPAMPSPAVSIASRLSAHAAPFVPPSQMLPAAGAGVQAPMDDDDQDMENIDAWQAHVEGARELQKLESEIEAFRRKIAQKEQLKQQQQQIQQKQPAPQPLASTTSSSTSLFGTPTTTTPPALPMAAAPRAQEAADDATKRDQELARLRGEAMANRARLKAQRHAEWMAHVCARALDTLARDVLRETTANVVHDVAHQYAVLRRLTKPWVDRARATVAQRHANEDAKRHHARFTNAIYSDDAIFVPIGPRPLDNNACKERAAEAIYTHKLAIANKKEDNVPANEIWDFAPYSDIMHTYAASKLARLRSNNARGCQLWINVANHNDMSTRWFRVKFGLHGDTHLRTTVYKDCRITLRALTNTDNMHGRDVDDLGAVIFSLKDNPSTQWASEKTRLHQFFQSLTHRNPHLRVPLLITYWPSKQWEHDVTELHARLDLPSLGAVADFKILVMDPHTINEQMHKSIEWLAMHMEMNQPSLAVHDARAQFRAAVGEIERSTFFVPASTPPHQAAAMANARIDAFNAFLREMPVNWAPFVLPHLAVSHPFNLANASIKWLTEASQKRIISEQTPTRDLSDMLACAITQSINEMDRRLRALHIQ